MLFRASLGSSNYWYWYFLYLFILLLIIYRIYIKTEENIEKIKEDGLSKIEPPEKQDIVRLDELRKKRVICLVVIFFLPLLIGLMSGASGKLLDEVMRMTHFRVESPVLHIKEPYSAFVPESLLAKKQLGVKGFTSFEGASVLLKGFGKTMVIEFSDGDTKRKLEVPNDQIIVEER